MPPTVSQRVETAPACDVINLTEAEKNIYCGAGWKLAQFHDGRLVGFFDPMAVEAAEVQKMAEAAAAAARAWLSALPHADEAWLVMCSCYQLCDPRRITLADPGSFAHMMRVFGEQFAGL